MTPNPHDRFIVCRYQLDNLKNAWRNLGRAEGGDTALLTRAHNEAVRIAFEVERIILSEDVTKLAGRRPNANGNPELFLEEIPTPKPFLALFAREIPNMENANDD